MPRPIVASREEHHVPQRGTNNGGIHHCHTAFNCKNNGTVLSQDGTNQHPTGIAAHRNVAAGAGHPMFENSLRCHHGGVASTARGSTRHGQTHRRVCQPVDAHSRCQIGADQWLDEATRHQNISTPICIGDRDATSGRLEMANGWRLPQGSGPLHPSGGGRHARTDDFAPTAPAHSGCPSKMTIASYLPHRFFYVRRHKTNLKTWIQSKTQFPGATAGIGDCHVSCIL